MLYLYANQCISAFNYKLFFFFNYCTHKPESQNFFSKTLVLVKSRPVSHKWITITHTKGLNFQDFPKPNFFDKPSFKFLFVIMIPAIVINVLLIHGKKALNGLIIPQIGKVLKHILDIKLVLFLLVYHTLLYYWTKWCTFNINEIWKLSKIRIVNFLKAI